MTQRPPSPGYVHEAYQHRADLIRDWLNGHPITAGFGHYLLVDDEPATPMLAEYWPEAEDKALTRHVLTRQTAVGPAPFVGRPFVYRWHVAQDERGRYAAAGDVAIQHVDLTA